MARNAIQCYATIGKAVKKLNAGDWHRMQSVRSVWSVFVTEVEWIVSTGSVNCGTPVWPSIARHVWCDAKPYSSSMCHIWSTLAVVEYLLIDDRRAELGEVKPLVRPRRGSKRSADKCRAMRSEWCQMKRRCVRASALAYFLVITFRLLRGKQWLIFCTNSSN